MVIDMRYSSGLTPPSEGKGKSVNSKKILVIEDDADVRHAIKGLLEQSDYSVIEAGDGITGEKQALLQNPGIIILDLGLPERRGEEILQFIRKHEPTKNIPVIVLTGEGSVSKKLSCMFKGANKFIHKPYDNFELLKAVKEFS
mgnify:CR=1 FL=1